MLRVESQIQLPQEYKMKWTKCMTSMETITFGIFGTLSIYRSQTGYTYYNGPKYYQNISYSQQFKILSKYFLIVQVMQQLYIIALIKLKHCFSQTVEFILSFKLPDSLTRQDVLKARIHVTDARITKHPAKRPVSNLGVSR